MKRYEQFAEEITHLIKIGVLQAGQKLPSIRQASKSYKISPSTIFKAYYLLEDRGLIFAREKSGYFVQSLFELPEPGIKRKSVITADVCISDLVFSVYDTIKENNAVLFGAFDPSVDLYPIARLSRSMSHGLTDLQGNEHHYIADMITGNVNLRRQIALRYMLNNVHLSLDEIVITNGAMEALNLCLQAVTKPGDLVAIESPAFYVILQILERLKLKAVEIPTHPRNGIDLDALAKTLETSNIKACCLMTNFQNPTGASISDEDSAKLYDILYKYQVPAIIDDVYHELHFDITPPILLKGFDQDGLIMHCSSFSKSLAPGYRVGYVAGGRYTKQINHLKLMSSLSPSIPSQVAISNYLQSGGYDRHLRKLRNILARSQASMLSAIMKYFPKDIAVTKPKGGYFLWVELNENVDSLKLYQEALEHNICIVPGSIFSTSQEFHNCIRLNYGQVWSDELENAMRKLGNLIKLCK